MTDAYDELLARAERAERERDRLATDALAALAGAGICTPEEGYVKSPHCLASNISDLMRERDEARNAVQAAHYEVSETYVQRDAARAEARAAQAHVALLREALKRADDWQAPVASISPQLSAEIDACHECALNRERKWPPSGLCEKHYCACDDTCWRPNERRAVTPFQVHDILRTALAATDAEARELVERVREEARREAFASIALEIRASIACAKRDGDVLDEDWAEASAEQCECYAEGDGAPDDERMRRLLAQPAEPKEEP
jgi:hypothetical protein